MQFNPVVLFVEMPVYRIFVTKIPKNQSFFLPLKNKLQLPIKNT